MARDKRTKADLLEEINVLENENHLYAIDYKNVSLENSKLADTAVECSNLKFALSRIPRVIHQLFKADYEGT